MNIKRILSLSLLLCSGFAAGMEPAGAKPAISAQQQALNDQLFEVIESNWFFKEFYVKKLIALGAHVNAKNKSGSTPLMRVITKEGITRIVKILIENGAQLEEKDNVGDTALMIAAMYDNADALELLLSKGANTNAKNRYGSGALWYAADQGNYGIVAILLGHKLNPGFPTEQEMQLIRKEKNTYFSIIHPDLIAWFCKKYGTDAIATNDAMKEVEDVVYPKMKQFIHSLISKREDYPAFPSKKFSRYDMMKNSVPEFENLPIFPSKK